jgi:hypothetical protein
MTERGQPSQWSIGLWPNASIGTGPTIASA